MSSSVLSSSWRTWDDFWKRTGIAGASHAGKASGPIRRTFWLVTFLAGVALTAWSVAVFFQEYLSYPVTTTISLTSQQQIGFPSVTVCNQNAVSCRALNSAVVACDANMTSPDCPFANATSLHIAKIIRGANCAPPPPKRGVNDSTTAASPASGPTSYASNTSFSDMRNVFMYHYFLLSETERMAIGHAFEDFVKDCTYEERSCIKGDLFFMTNSPSFGNCFSFNSAMKDNGTGSSGSATASLTGPRHGLTLVLDIEQNAYMTGGQTQQAGAKVSIHAPSVLPFPDEFGINVMSSTQTTFAVQEMTISRYPAPYTSQCTSDWATYTNYSSFLPFSTYAYSLAQCQRFCLHDAFESICGCFHPGYLDTEASRKGRLPCNLVSNTTAAECVAKERRTQSLQIIRTTYSQSLVTGAIAGGNRVCNCSVECSQTDYNLQISQAAYPSKNFENQAGWNYNVPNDRISHDLLQIQVYFSTMTVQQVEESPTYQFSDGSFMSSLGGALSLYLGIAIATVFEVLEFFLDLGINVARGKERKEDH